MKVHFIAIGGSAMHNLALALNHQGHEVSGSDDEIYDPSRSRLAKAGLLPEKYGWFPEKITPALDAIILGMHARPDNPELLRAQELGLKVHSYPEYVAMASQDKKRVVIAGSHGKTTTTSIIMNALEHAGVDFDYLVGAQLEGYDRMVRLSDAPLIILEGDEYLSSPIDRRPKMLHYRPHIAVVTGIAWDHINVFPTEKMYNEQFALFARSMQPNGKLFYYGGDTVLDDVLAHSGVEIQLQAYDHIPLNDDQEITYDNRSYPVNLIGSHNMQNIKAAQLVCAELGMDAADFFSSLADFKGAGRRLQIIRQGSEGRGYLYLDFAHAPSKVRATVQAVKETYPDTPLTAILELHTFSSLNREFLPHYKDSMRPADKAYVFYDTHTLKMKRMEDLEEDYVQNCFGGHVKILTDKSELESIIHQNIKPENNLLIMSSGKLGGVKLQ